MTAKPYGPNAFAEELNVSRETLEDLTAYAELLLRWQKTINLVAPSTLPDLWRRHMLDSGQLLDHAPPEARTWLDIGSGGGFPGLVLSILLADRPDTRVHLVESDARKCAFLREVARLTQAPAEVHRSRIERLKPFPADVVMTRALAPLTRILEYAEPFSAAHTRLLLLKGQNLEDEMEEAARCWDFEAETVPSRSDQSGRVVIFQGFRRA